MRKIILSFISLILLILFLSPGLLLAVTVTSTENVTVSATVVGSGTPPPPPPGNTSSGGGRSIPRPPVTSSQFSGEAYPYATVTVLKNGVIVTTVKADKDGLFSVTLEEKYDSTIVYSLYAKDIEGNKSILINYPLVITAGYLTYLSGIRFPPTITLDKVQVKIGNSLTIAGYTLPKKELQLIIIEDKNKKSTIFTLNALASGRYNITLPLTGLPKGDYSLYVKYPNDTRISKIQKFTIGDTNIKSADANLKIPGDSNFDGIINLTDFSVMAFWYKKANPPASVDTNGDGIIDLTDFSILAFYWSN